MRANSNVTIGKKKKAHPTENRHEIAVCPNCQYHFKFTIKPQTAKTSYSNGLSFQSSPEERKLSSVGEQLGSERDFVSTVRSNKQKEEEILIESIANTGSNTLDKLRKLNDLKELKKSRYLNLDELNFPNKKDNAASYQNTDTYQVILSPSLHKQQLSLGPGFDASFKTDRKESRYKLKGKELSPQGKRQSRAQLLDIVSGYIEMKALLSRLIDWIETSYKRDNLPYHLKMMVTHYLAMANDP